MIRLSMVFNPVLRLTGNSTKKNWCGETSSHMYFQVIDSDFPWLWERISRVTSTDFRNCRYGFLQVTCADFPGLWVRFPMVTDTDFQGYRCGIPRSRGGFPGVMGADFRAYECGFFELWGRISEVHVRISRFTRAETEGHECGVSGLCVRITGERGACAHACLRQVSHKICSPKSDSLYPSAPTYIAHG